jgi:hypothetical protein
MKCPIATVVVADNPQLNVTIEYLSRSLASLEFDDSFERHIETAAGFVTSQKPSTGATLVLNLKDERLSYLWSAQIEHTIIGNVSAYGVIGRKFELSNCAIIDVEAGEPTRIIIGGTITKEAASAGMNA